MVDHSRLPGVMPAAATAEEIALPKVASQMDADVSTPSPVYEVMAAARKLPRALWGGTAAMRAVGKPYLRPHVAEDEDEYQERLDLSFLTPFFAEAVNSTVGRVFSRPLLLEDVPDDLAELWPNIDSCGTHGDIFAAEVCRDSVLDGVSGVLIDYPRTDGVETLAQEQAMGLRSFWLRVPASDILEALGENINGQMRLQRLRIKEQAYEQVGAWSSRLVKRIRVFQRNGGNPVTWQVWRYDDESKVQEWVLEAEGALKLTEIPFVPFYTDRTGFFTGKPAFSNLADLCLKHFNEQSDYDHVRRVCARPVLVATGMSMDQFTESAAGGIGPARALVFTSHEAAAQWLELSGASLPELRASLEDLQGAIRMAALDPLMQRASGSDKATRQLLEQSQISSRLQAWAIGWADSASECLRYTAEWMGIDPGAAGQIAIREEVMGRLGTDGSRTARIELLKAGALSKRTAIEESKRAGDLDELLDVDAELAQIEAEGDSVVDKMMAAIDQRQQQEPPQSVDESAPMV